MGMPAPLWTTAPIPGLERSLWARSEFSSRGLVKFLTAICPLPHLWHHDLPWPRFHISLIYQQCFPFLEGLWIHIPRAYTPWICEASSEDPLGSWTFPLCKLLATSWADWLQGVWGFCEGIHSRSVLMESSAIYWLQWISLRPWRVRASCVKLGWRRQNCRTSSQIPARMRNLATWHSPLFTAPP